MTGLRRIPNDWEGSTLLAYPMHGQRKLLAEGYRTRDGHLIEWAGRLLERRGGVTVVSRPEPAMLPAAPRRDARTARGTRAVETASWRLPSLRDRRRWWVTSADAYPAIPTEHTETPALVWNPFTALAPQAANPFTGGRKVVLDLLDDWSIHYAFASIRDDVEEAYREAFRLAHRVTANSEGTATLARRFGRDDVVLLPNGCDPERFSTRSRASGPFTVGYVGKIGRRLPLAEIVSTITASPEVSFVFAGPVLDREYRAPLAALDNVTLLGDVHYDDVPRLLESFDAGWVPHGVGAREVGGDIIKAYEYRAAGLPVLSTPVAGITSRGLGHIDARPMAEHASWIKRHSANGPRLQRRVSPIPAHATWRSKSITALRNLDLVVERNGAAS
jgi:glycosyltransferase involved in cell wall biosynthesis